MADLRALEFFSGIGCLAYAAKEHAIHVVASFDLNPHANETHKLNFPDSSTSGKRVESLKPHDIDKFGANVWLLSPPCQPFSRRGKKRAGDDPRCDGLRAIIRLLCEVASPPTHFLLENVEGFEESSLCSDLIDALKHVGLEVSVHVLSPHQFGVPNTRDRVWVLGKRINGGHQTLCPVPHPMSMSKKGEGLFSHQVKLLLMMMMLLLLHPHIVV